MNDESTAQRDRNLLFGVFAVRNHFINAQQLSVAAAAGAAEPGKDLGAVLVSLGHLSEKNRRLIGALLDARIADHGGDAGATLGDFGGEPAVRDSFPASIRVSEKAVESSLASFGGDLSAPAGEAPAAGESLDDREHITLEHPGRYSIKSEHGRGGIGRVMIALDEHIGREVALKELLPEPGLAGSPRSASPRRKTAFAAARFLREARITGQLEHPGIVPVYEIGKRGDGSNYYTMKLVRGQTLEQKIRECKGLPERLRLLTNFLDLCQAMAYAHAKGVIHRDLKPANVMVGEFGETVVLDWGLAKVKGMVDERAGDLAEGLRLIKESGAGETMAGAAIGTPSYMSPEQAEGRVEEIDERSDVWSLGAILFEILTGTTPFGSGSAWEVMGRVLTEEAPPAAERERKAPPELSAIARRCLTKDRDYRYQDARALAVDAANYLSGGRVKAYRYTRRDLLRKWYARNREKLGWLGVTAALLILGLFMWSYLLQGRKDRAVAFFNRGAAEESMRHFELAREYYAASLRLEKDAETWSRFLALSVPGPRPGSGRLAAGAYPRKLDWGPDPVAELYISPDGKTLSGISGDKFIMEYYWQLPGLVRGTQNFNIGVRNKRLDRRFFRTFDLEQGTTLSLIELAIAAPANREPARAQLPVAFAPRRHVVAAFQDRGEATPGVPALVLTEVTEQTEQVYRSPWDISPAEDLALALSHDGSLLAVSCVNPAAENSRVAVFQFGAETLEAGPQWTFRRDPEFAGNGRSILPQALTFSPDDERLAFGVGGELSVVGARDGKLKWRAPAGGLYLSALAVSPDGKWLASAGCERQTAFALQMRCRRTALKIWDAGAGRLEQSCAGLPSDLITDLLFLDNDKLAAASLDGSVRLWDRRSPAPVGELTRARGPARAYSLAYAPDRKTLAVGYEDGAVFFFPRYLDFFDAEAFIGQLADKVKREQANDYYGYSVYAPDRGLPKTIQLKMDLSKWFLAYWGPLFPLWLLAPIFLLRFPVAGLRKLLYARETRAGILLRDERKSRRSGWYYLFHFYGLAVLILAAGVIILFIIAQLFKDDYFLSFLYLAIIFAGPVFSLVLTGPVRGIQVSPRHVLLRQWIWTSVRSVKYIEAVKVLTLEEMGQSSFWPKLLVRDLSGGEPGNLRLKSKWRRPVVMRVNDPKALAQTIMSLKPGQPVGVETESGL